MWLLQNNDRKPMLEAGLKKNKFLKKKFLGFQSLKFFFLGFIAGRPQHKIMT